MRIRGDCSTSSLRHWKYDAFISFRGEDTRKSFTDHLHEALKRKGINVFKDDNGLDKGKSIAPELSKAIEESRISIIVFSRNYGSSTWCLDELVQIVQSMNKNKQIVIPIFYDVDPSTVRNQTNTFEDAFIEHERKNKEKVQNWRNALKIVANLSGFHLEDSHETTIIQNIVKKIHKLIPKRFKIEEELVGMTSHLEKLMTLLTSNIECENGQMIGIYGMGGIGKTTIARVVCDLISHEFDGVSFLENVREISKGSNGHVHLQYQLLSQILGETFTIWDVGSGINMIRRMMGNKKVLVVIDDVDNIEQLSALAGKPNWFGLGSKIIITTRDKHLLKTHGVDDIYEVEKLDDAKALKLFSLKAFKKSLPLEEYMELSKHIVKYASGLPLALQVLGSFLFGRTINEWKSAFERLCRDSNKAIFCCLRISFDGLEEKDKKIFLDIACFFKGKNKDHVLKILDGCGFSPDIGISVLVDKCLLNVSMDNTLRMHDLLQEMGQQIVKRESIDEPEKRSRLWEKADVLYILTKNMGTKQVEGIILDEEEQLNVNVSAKTFFNMTKLRLLKIRNVQLLEGLEYLSNELRLLDWHAYSSKSLPSSLRLEKTVVLQLQCSRIEQLCKEVQPLNNLKVINLSHSKMFKKLPDPKQIPNLEELILEGCTSLYDIHPSLLVHEKLILLNMKDCTSLTNFPSEMGMKSLKTLLLSGCLRLKKFPNIVKSMECLVELFLDRTGIKELPLSIEFLTGLILLSLEDCRNLVSLPSNINCLKSLRTLKMSGCQKFENLPENFGQMKSLEVLDIRGTATREPESNSWYSCFPLNLMSRRSSSPLTLKFPSLSGLISLKDLDLSYRNIEAIPSDIGNLASLEWLYLNGNHFVSLPPSINRLSKLNFINLNSCKRLQSVPELPSNVGYVGVEDCSSLRTLSITPETSHNVAIMGHRSCFKLLNYDETSKLFSSMKKKPGPVYNYQITITILGSEIPKWFKYKCEGSSINIKEHHHRDLELKGYVLCVVFFVHKLHPGLCKSELIYLSCNISKGFMSSFGDLGQGLPDHCWLLYIPADSSRKPKDWYDFELKFESSDPTRLEVRRCGAHPIYEEVDECSSFVSGNLIEFHQDSVRPNIDLATSEFSLAVYAGAKSSGSGNPDEDEPQAKRQKML